MRGAFEVGVVSSNNPALNGWANGLWTVDARYLLQHFLQSQGMQSQNGQAGYDINVTLASAEPPGSGLDMTAQELIRYQVISNKDQSIVLEESIQTDHTTDLGESLVGANRVRLAVEGATRENFIRFLEKLNAPGALARRSP